MTFTYHVYWTDRAFVIWLIETTDGINPEYSLQRMYLLPQMFK